MKTTIETKLLLRALNLVGVAVPSRSSLPVLSAVKIEAGASGVTLSTTDLDLFATERIAKAETKRDGAAVVPFHLLSRFVGRISAITTTLALKGNELVVSGGDASAKFETLSPEDFPARLTVDTNETFACAAGDLLTPLRKVAYAMCTDTSRWTLMGVHAKSEKDGLVFVATDGRRLSLCRSGIKTEGKVNAILPDKLVRAMLRNIDAAEINVSISETGAKVVAGDSELRSRLVEGQYPNWQSVWPENTDKAFSCAREDLAEGIRTAGLFVDPHLPWVAIEGQGNQIAVSCGHKSRSMILGSELAGQPAIKIGFNQRYLLDALDVLDRDEVRIECSDPQSPMLIREDGFSAIVMPMAVDVAPKQEAAAA